MPAKKTTRTRTTKPAVKASLIDKHAGILKQFANYGFAGLAFGYLLTVTIPEAQKSFTATIEKQVEQNREDRKDAFSHGEKAVEKISSSIDGLKDVFQTNQRAGHANQRDSIAVQEKIAELIEKQNEMNAK